MAETLTKVGTSTNPNLTGGDKFKLAAQGALFNLSDEIFGLFKGAMSGELTVAEAIAKERELLKQAQDKSGSLKWEIGGAVLPGLLAAPFTGGASLVPTLGRTAAIGAGQGLLATYGASEGNPIERVTENPAELAIGGVTGSVVGPAGRLVAKGVSKLGVPITKLADYISRKFPGNKRLPKAAEDEVLRIINESGYTIEQALDKIKSGAIIPDLTEETAIAVRGLYKDMGEGGRVLGDALRKRRVDLSKSSIAEMVDELAPGASSSNVTRAVGQTKSQLEASAGKEYKTIYRAADPDVGMRLNSKLVEMLNIDPTLRRTITKHLARNRLPPLFKVEKGQATLIRSSDLETAEVVRRALKDSTNHAFNSGKSAEGAALRTLERELRDEIDIFSPELKAVRAQWANIQAANDAFGEGRNILGKPLNDALIYVQDLMTSNNADAIASFRAGVATQLQNKAGKTRSTRTTLVNTLASLTDDDETGMRAIMRALYPEDSIEAALEKLDVASAAIRSHAKIVGGSSTALTQGASQRTGSTQTLVLGLARMKSGDVAGGARQIITGILGNRAKGLTQEQYTKIANLLVEENPNALRRALERPEAQEAVVRAVNKLYDSVLAGSSSAAAITVAPLPMELGAIEQARGVMSNMMGQR
tara:strand:- start:1596 stop:3539 length:1944 start_codon:yes stop_codon:yes gene_type:complete